MGFELLAYGLVLFVLSFTAIQFTPSRTAPEWLILLEVAGFFVSLIIELLGAAYLVFGR